MNLLVSQRQNVNMYAMNHSEICPHELYVTWVSIIPIFSQVRLEYDPEGYAQLIGTNGWHVIRLNCVSIVLQVQLDLSPLCRLMWGILSR